MKTTADLNALIPQIVKMVIEDPQIGDGEYENNKVSYNSDGWEIEVSFRCRGEWDEDPGDYWTPSNFDLKDIDAEVTEISAYHYDKATEEESDFEEDELEELWDAVSEALNEIA